MLEQVALAALAAVVGYAVGMLNPAATIARIRGTDLRSVGSGNPGATNAGRAFGWKVGVLVGVLDILKGYLPVIAFEALGLHVPALVAGLAAVVGHITSPLLRGRGGKGVATSFGAILAVQPVWAIPVLAVFALVWAITRRVGLASVAGCLALVPAAVLFHDPTSDIVFAALLALLVLVRHRQNLRAALTPR
ncbi:MAG: glycerol-3-phosphate 1-O-acyltransferase PlsY [Candidatus Nanopelagicales bacterium]